MQNFLKFAALSTLRRKPVRALAAPLAQFMVGFGLRLRAGLADSHSCQWANCEEVAGTPILVELMGPSGVGKTTLGRALLADKALRAQLRPYGDLKSSVVALQEVPSGTWGTAAHRNDREYRELLRLKTENVQSQSLSVADLARLLGFHVRILQQDLLLTTHNRDTVVLRDDGLLHNFSADFDLALQQRIDVRSLLAHRVAIFMSAPDSLIARRAIGREQRGESRSQYVGLLSEEAEPIVAAASAQIGRLAKALSRLGVPSLTVDAAAPTQENVAIIRDFLPGAVAACRRIG